MEKHSRAYHLWSLLFILLYLFLVLLGFLLIAAVYATFPDLPTLHFWILILATWRLVRLVQQDSIMSWLREIALVENYAQAGAFRQVVHDLFACPWCLGIWTAAIVVFSYLILPVTYYLWLLLAVAAVASFLQVFAKVLYDYLQK